VTFPWERFHKRIAGPGQSRAARTVRFAARTVRRAALGRLVSRTRIRHSTEVSTHRDPPRPEDPRRARRERPVTIRDVAREAGVGLGTVSRALGSGELIREDTRARVVAAALRVGYRPSRAAKVLRGVRARVVGVIVPDLSLPLYGRWLRAAGEAARRHGYVLLVCDGQNSRQVIEQQLERLYEEQIDGLVVAGPIHGLPQLERFAASGIPVVPEATAPQRRALRRNELRENVERAAALDGFRRLTSLGHRKIAYFAYVERDTRFVPPMQRFRIGCLQRSLEEAGASLDERLVVPASDSDECRTLAADLLARSDRPTAVVPGTEALTPAVLAAIGDAGLVVPEDVSMVAFGDSLWEQAYRPPISVVRFDYRLAGSMMIDHLVARIEHAAVVPPLPDFASEFIDRGSIARPPRAAAATGSRRRKRSPGAAPGRRARTSDPRSSTSRGTGAPSAARGRAPRPA
jgi:LacI family transcriptional regulator